MDDFSNHIWPDPHAVDHTETNYLDIALRSADWSHTEMCSRFEREFASYVGANHALMVPSGTAAVYLALVVAGIRPGQEVIIPGITWPSVVYAIIKAGGIPRTVDISHNTLCMGIEEIKEAHSDRTFAILATHLFGSQCDMQYLCEYADENNLKIIEDSAQSLGSVQRNKFCGTWGVAGAYSLNDRKVLACGEGGCIVTDSSEFYEELKRIQLIQPVRPVFPNSLPGTYKVSEFQAAVALGQLEKLDEKLKLMAARADYFGTLLKRSGGSRVSVQAQPDCVDFQSYYNFAFLVHEDINADHYRARLTEKLNLRISAPYKPLCDITDLHPTKLGLPADAAANLSKRHVNCLHAYNQTCMRIPHYALLSDEPTLEVMVNVIIATLDEDF